jgi:small subunit ribosomal protein S1
MMQDDGPRGPNSEPLPLRGDEAAQARSTNSPANARQEPEEDVESMSELLAEPDATMRTLRRGDFVEGTVVQVTPNEVLVDIGMKSEGIIPLRELQTPEGIEELHVGDRIIAYVLQPEDQEGHAILSLRRAGQERAWRRLEEIARRGEVIEAKVIDYNKGGVVVDVGLRGFVPLSQIVSLRRTSETETTEELAARLKELVGRTLSLKVVEIDRKRNRLILSERNALRDLRARQREELFEELEPGQIRRGRVSNLASFGAFVDLGGVDGLIHVSELSWSRVNHPSEVVQVGDEVDVYVMSVDRETKKIALSLKRARPDPWSTIDQRYEVGQELVGTVTQIKPFGVFVRLEDGIEGLVHTTELEGVSKNALREGQLLRVRVLSIDPERRRLSLALADEPFVEASETGSSETTAEAAVPPDVEEAPAPSPAAESSGLSAGAEGSLAS